MVNSAEIFAAKILIVDDIAANVLLLEQMLSDAGYSSITSTRDPRVVCDLHRENHYDLILLDLLMPGMDGFQVMEALKEIETDSYVPVLVITAQPTHKLRALEVGAKDFISKPFDLVEVQTRIHNMLEVRLLYKKIVHDNLSLEQRVRERTEELTRANLLLTKEIEDRRRIEESLKGSFAEINRLRVRLQAENIYLQQELAQDYNFGEFIGQGSAIAKLFSLVEQVAPQNATVLLLGETGTGKGVVARAIHSRSARKDRPMITVNCAALPANLIESELFGREKGAFTGASARQIGRFELANGGTIFLDEVGEMPLELQGKLLRVIQDGEFERLGSPHSIKVDVRIIAATNRKLEEEIEAGRFRKDLFYRLNVFPIMIPPLRRRLEDIPILVNHCVAKFNKKMGKQITTVSQETMNLLQEYHWPGNVRELESVVERAVITSQGPTLRVLDRFPSLLKKAEPAVKDIKALADLEQEHIRQVLLETNWRIEGENGAAQLLGLNPSTLRGRMRKYGIRR